MRSVILSLVERGWGAAREASLNEPSVKVIHVIKGSVNRSILDLYNKRPNIDLVALPHAGFWPIVWLWAQSLRLTGHLKACWVDNERSQKRLSGKAFLGAGASIILKTEKSQCV